jgi:hypothetical protein
LVGIERADPLEDWVDAPPFSVTPVSVLVGARNSAATLEYQVSNCDEDCWLEALPLDLQQRLLPAKVDAKKR